MRIPLPDLTRKALLALEEALNQCDQQPLSKSSMSLRFALAYLYSVSRSDRGCFDAFWKAVTDTRRGPSEYLEGVVRASEANSNLNAIYRAVGVRRTNQMMFYAIYAEQKEQHLKE